MDSINIKNLKIFAHHGVLEYEKENGQFFYVSAKLLVDTYPAGRYDDLTLSVNYDEVCHLIKNTMTEKNYDLIEAAANKVAEVILKSYPLVHEVTITLSKPDAPVELTFENISVTVNRAWHTAYVALGSNLGDSEKYLKDAIAALKIDENIKNISVSSFISTAPYGYEEQPDFLNAVVCFKTLYTPNELLQKTQAIENNAKRVREIHWGPRTLDLDILFYDDLIMYTENLVIPHPEIEKRTFVLEPLMELNPYMIHPLLHKSVKELYELLGCHRPV